MSPRRWLHWLEAPCADPRYLLFQVFLAEPAEPLVPLALSTS